MSRNYDLENFILCIYFSLKNLLTLTARTWRKSFSNSVVLGSATKAPT